MEQASFTALTFEDLLPAIKANDEKALQHLYAVNYPAVARYVERNSGTADDAKDIFQEAFLATWHNIQLNKFEPVSPSALSAYLFQVAKHKWIDHLRNTKTKRTTGLDGMETNGIETDNPVDDNEEYIKAVTKEMKSLGGKCFDLLKRFYYYRQSMREIAQHYNWTEPSAKNNKYRCLQELRTLVKNKIQK